MPDRFGPSLIGSLWACAGIVAGSLARRARIAAANHARRKREGRWADLGADPTGAGR
jgi:hypothetical protein